MANIPKIYYITKKDIENSVLLGNTIYPNLGNNYYWSDDWSYQFYIQLCYAGFICVSFDHVEQLVLLPEMQIHYALLDFKDLHISKKVFKLIKDDKYELKITNSYKDVLKNIGIAHKDNWIKGEYIDLLDKLSSNKHNNFELICVELYDKNDKKLVAGEIGYIIGSTYTSLSGFSLKLKHHNNCGNLQLVLLAKYLEKNNFDFWNLGHPYMEYKLKLGAKVYSRDDFLSRWFGSRDKLL